MVGSHLFIACSSWSSRSSASGVVLAFCADARLWRTVRRRSRGDRDGARARSQKPADGGRGAGGALADETRAADRGARAVSQASLARAGRAARRRRRASQRRARRAARRGAAQVTASRRSTSGRTRPGCSSPTSRTGGSTRSCAGRSSRGSAKASIARRRLLPVPVARVRNVAHRLSARARGARRRAHARRRDERGARRRERRGVPRRGRVVVRLRDAAALAATRRPQLTLRGVGALDAGTLVLDVGGGSTELIDAHAFRTSLDIGSVRLTERFLHGDPPTAASSPRGRRGAASCCPGSTATRGDRRRGDGRPARGSSPARSTSRREAVDAPRCDELAALPLGAAAHASPASIRARAGDRRRARSSSLEVLRRYGLDATPLQRPRPARRRRARGSRAAGAGRGRGAARGVHVLLRVAVAASIVALAACGGSGSKDAKTTTAGSELPPGCSVEDVDRIVTAFLAGAGTSRRRRSSRSMRRTRATAGLSSAGSGRRRWRTCGCGACSASSTA